MYINIYIFVCVYVAYICTRMCIYEAYANASVSTRVRVRDVIELRPERTIVSETWR